LQLLKIITTYYYVNLFERIQNNKGPLGKWASQGYCFSKLEGELGPRMQFGGKDILNWSLNDYLGLANHPECVKQILMLFNMELLTQWERRMMSGHTK
jgi:glycine C-acetyltransferase